MRGEGHKTNLLYRKTTAYAVICALILGVVGVGAFYVFFAPRDPIPAKIRSGAAFTLYYPGSLPANWSIDKSTFQFDPTLKVVSYQLKSPTGNLNIAIEPTPPNFNFGSMYISHLANPVQFLTSLGQGVVGKTEGHPVGSIVTSSSWILASPSTNNIDLSNIQFVLSHLQIASH